MSEPENRAQGLSEAVDWKQECLDLRRQVNLLLIAQLVIGVVVTAFIFLQFIRTSRDLTAILPQAVQNTENLKKQEAGLAVIKARLIEYGQKHPDYMPILQKYGIQVSAASPGGPMPVAAPPPQK